MWNKKNCVLKHTEKNIWMQGEKKKHDYLPEKLEFEFKGSIEWTDIQKKMY